jgi:hypothetical protein
MKTISAESKKPGYELSKKAEFVKMAIPTSDID